MKYQIGWRAVEKSKRLVELMKYENMTWLLELLRNWYDFMNSDKGFEVLEVSRDS